MVFEVKFHLINIIQLFLSTFMKLYFGILVLNFLILGRFAKY
jgi:hypothetical protein